MKKKILVISGVLVGCVGFVLLLAIANHYLSTRSVLVRFQNISTVNVVSVDKNGVEDKIVAVITKNNSDIRLQKEGKYKFKYYASEGYANGETIIDVTTAKSPITLKPYYSADKLKSMLEAEYPTIRNTIAGKYGPTLSNYIIGRGNLYHFGEWYGTTLIYKGNGLYNKDNLRLVLKKNDGNWEVANPLPQIALTIYDSPGIPRDILQNTNNYNPTTGQ